MSKLFQLKAWLTVKEAASHLTTIFGEAVTEADIFRLCLDRKLTLSVVFIDGHLASPFKLIEDESLVEYLEVPSLDGRRSVKLPVGGQILYAPSGHMYQCQNVITDLEEDWPYDLVMVGGERITIEENYWRLGGGNREEFSNIDGSFVSEGETIFQLKAALPRAEGDPAQFYPLGRLPENKLVVVKTGALLELEQLVAGKRTTPEQLSTNERNTLLVMIAALCKEAGINPQDKSAAAKIERLVERLVDALGLTKGITDETVKKHLDKIPEALRPRMK